MAGILFDIKTDLENLREANEEIEKLKKNLSQIDVNVDFKIANDIEQRIKNLLGDVQKIQTTIANTTKTLAESRSIINSISKQNKGDTTGKVDIAAKTKEYEAFRAEIEKARKAGDDWARQSALIDQVMVSIKRDMVEHSQLGTAEQNIEYLTLQKKMLAELGVEKKQVMALMTSEIKTNSAVKSSYDETNNALKKATLEYHALSEEQKRSVDGRKLAADIKAMSDSLKEQDAVIGNFGRHVGNYERAYNGLNVALMQVLRETPSLAMNLQTYLMAISNNLPILADEIINVSKSAGSFNGVLKTLWGTFKSFSFWVTVITTALTFVPQLWEWVKGLTESGKAAKKAAEEHEYYAKVAKNISSSLLEKKMKLEDYYKIATDVNEADATRLEAAKRILKEYPNILKGLNAEAIMAGNAAEAYKELVKQIDLYIKAEALKQMAVDNYKKQYEFDLTHDNIQKFIKSNPKFVKNVKDMYNAGWSNKDIRQVLFQGDASIFDAGWLDTWKKKQFRDQIKRKEIGQWKKTDERDAMIDGLISFWGTYKDEIAEQDKVIAEGERINRELENIQNQIGASTILDLGGANVKTPKSTGTTQEQRNNEILKARQDFADEYIQLLEKLQGDISEAEIELLDESLQTEIRKIKDNSRKEREEIKEQLRKYAEEKAKLEKEIWLNEDANRKEADYAPSKTIEQIMADILANPKDQFTIGYNVRLGQIGEGETKGIRELLKASLEEYQDYHAKRNKLAEDFAKKGQGLLGIKTMALQTGDEVLLAQAESAFEELKKQYQSDLLSLDFDEFQKTDLWVKGFEDLQNVSVHTLDLLKTKLTEFKQTAVTTLKDPSEIQSFIDMLEKVEDEIQSRGESTDNYVTAQNEYNTALNEYRTYLATLPTEEQRTAVQQEKLAKLADNLAKKYKNLSDATSKLVTDLNSIGTEVKNSGNGIKNLGDNFDGAFKDVSNAVGDSLISVAELTTGSIDAFFKIKDAFALTGKGIEVVSAKITAAMGAIGLILTIVNTVIELTKSFIQMEDNKKQKLIENLEKEIEASQRIYDKLEKAIDKAYGSDKADELAEANKELERQNDLIAEQMRLEESKKSTDEEKMDDYRDKQRDIEEQIEENKEANVLEVFEDP